MDDNNQDIKKALDEIFFFFFIEIDVKKENIDEKNEETLSTETLNDIIQTPKLEENDKAVINYSNKINDDINENKDKKEKVQIKKTKFSDIDLFEEGHEEEPDELDLIDGLIKDPATTQDKEHNAYLRLMHEYKAEYAKREKCIKVGILLIIISAVVFLALMFSLDSKTFFLTLWIIFIISGIAVMTRIDYRCYKYEKILGIKNTDKEDDLEKMKNDIDKTISNAKTELENAKANIKTTIESAKKDISRLSGMKTREQENK